MALRIELNGVKPGIAKLSAEKWLYSADTEIMIQRNQDNYYFSGNNQWGPEKCWHLLNNLTVNNHRLEGLIDCWLIDTLLAQGGNSRFYLYLRECHNPTNTDYGVLNIKGDVLASNAIAKDIADITHDIDVSSINAVPTEDKDETTESTETIKKVNDTEVNPTPISYNQPDSALEPQPNRSLKKICFLLFGILLLVLILLGAFFMLTNHVDKDQSEQNTIMDNCALTQLKPHQELEFIQSCLQSKPSNNEILQLVKEAKEQKKCNIAQRLYANQSQKNADIALLYAKEYDEKYYQKNDCFSVDKDTAIYWYETVLDLAPQNEAAKNRLAELKQH